MLPPDERTPPPRPRQAYEGAPLTEAELGLALRELRDTWAGLTQVTLAKRAGLSGGSVVSARERGHGVPSTKVLDKLVIACLQHRGLTPQQVITELRYWQKARDTLDLRRREQTPTAPTPQPDPTPPTPAVAAEAAPAPVARDGSIQQAALEATNGAASPGPAPEATPEPVSEATPGPVAEGASRHRAGVRNRWVMGAAAAAVVVVAAIGGVIGLSGSHGPNTASGADKQSLPSAITPPQRLVDSPPYLAGATYSQTVNSLTGARTFTDPSGMVGEGDLIPNRTTVHVACKIVAPGPTSVGIYWYRITDPPWKNSYAPTNSFLNDDPISGSHQETSR